MTLNVFRFTAGRVKTHTLWKETRIPFRSVEEGEFRNMLTCRACRSRCCVFNAQLSASQGSSGPVAGRRPVPRHHVQMLHLQQPATVLQTGLYRPKPGGVGLRMSARAARLHPHANIPTQTPRDTPRSRHDDIRRNVRSTWRFIPYCTRLFVNPDDVVLLGFSRSEV